MPEESAVARTRKVLLVEDKRGMRSMLTTALREEGFEVSTASTGNTALKLLDGPERFDLILTDVCLPGADGMEVLAASMKSNPWAPVILMTAYGSIELAVDAMKQGARDFITKPFDLEELIGLVVRYAGSGPGAHSGHCEMIGSSPEFLEAVERARKGAATDLNLLIMGESGTGKELLARFVHESSNRSEGPFVPINCAAIPRELLESELFGAEKGAYTGSSEERPGKFEVADEGTIFLDEIGDMDAALQGKILRVLQEKEFTRVGGRETLRANVRVVSASNRDLESETRSGSFRKDLYFRLSEFPVRLPPLRSRKDDIPVLVEHFLRESGRPGIGVAEETMDAMLAYSWPGNIRELRSIVLRAAALCEEGGSISPELVETGSDAEAASGSGQPCENDAGLLEAGSKAAMKAERKMIVDALRACEGNRTRAAKMLKISYRTLLYRMKKLDISADWKGERS
jgi:DNA-binding NtrC family response regulator